MDRRRWKIGERRGRWKNLDKEESKGEGKWEKEVEDGKEEEEDGRKMDRRRRKMGEKWIGEEGRWEKNG